MSHPVSSLERVYGVRDQALSTYMHVINGSDQPEAYRDMAESMAVHSHPVVWYAAGWSAVEAATASDGQRASTDWGLKDRQESISFARDIWKRIDQAVWEDLVSGLPEAKRGLAWALAQRHGRALAYLPAFELVAQQVSGEVVTPHEAHAGMVTIKERITPLIDALIPPLRDSHNPYRSGAIGLAGELSTACFLQSELTSSNGSLQPEVLPSRLVVPASLRDEHHTESTLKANLLVMPLQPGADRMRIRVGGSRAEEESGPGTFYVNVGRDLYSNEFSSRRVLQAIKGLMTGDRQRLPAQLERVVCRLNNNLARSMSEKA